MAAPRGKILRVNSSGWTARRARERGGGPGRTFFRARLPRRRIIITGCSEHVAEYFSREYLKAGADDVCLRSSFRRRQSPDFTTENRFVLCDGNAENPHRYPPAPSAPPPPALRGGSEAHCGEVKTCDLRGKEAKGR